MKGRGTRLAGFGLGILASFGAYGVLQERIMSRPFGASAVFRVPAVLVLVNRVATLWIALLVRRGRIAGVSPRLLGRYALVATTNFLATLCQYSALAFVSFPLATLVKSGRLGPVMLVGHFFLGKRYNRYDYATTAAVTVGCGVFVLVDNFDDGNTAAGRGLQSPSRLWTGVGLAVLFLVFDAATSALQERLFADTKDLGKLDHLFWTNACAASLSLPVLMLGGSLGAGVRFAVAHPTLVPLSLLLALSSCVGQLCITATISEFGALVFATLMTARHVLSISLSCALFGHSLGPAKTLAAALVFGAVFARGWMSSRLKQKPKQSAV